MELWNKNDICETKLGDTFQVIDDGTYYECREKRNNYWIFKVIFKYDGGYATKRIFNTDDKIVSYGRKQDG